MDIKVVSGPGWMIDHMDVSSDHARPTTLELAHDVGREFEAETARSDL